MNKKDQIHQTAFQPLPGDRAMTKKGRNKLRTHTLTGVVMTLMIFSTQACAYPFQTRQPPQMQPTAAAFEKGWRVEPLITIGDTPAINQDVNLTNSAYRPAGILDGIHAFDLNKETVRIFISHELGAADGYPYQLVNGLSLTGARVSYFDIDRRTRKVMAAGPAYDTIFDRAGHIVTDPAQIHEGHGSNIDGFERFCSAQGLEKGEMGFEDDIYFTGEESSSDLGGQETVIDVNGRSLYVSPMLGRAAFENVTALDSEQSDKIVLLMGDDRGGTSLLLYIGQKNSKPEGGYNPPEFLVKNGLGNGNVYVWVADNGNTDPSQFNGTGSARSGEFVKIAHYNPVQAGTDGYDPLGFASLSKQDELAAVMGAFKFSRPEDVATNPRNGAQAVLASTGRDSVFSGADSWGMTYLIDVKLDPVLHKNLDQINAVPADIAIIYDGNDAGAGQFSAPDYGLRSPDNLDWANDGYIYIQEDRSFSEFGATSHEEASLWKLDPGNGKLERILQIDRNSVPLGQTDPTPGDIGNWESSGILDVSHLFTTRDGEKIFLLDTQAHNLTGEPRGANKSKDLVEGGQLLLMTKDSQRNQDHDNDKENR